MVDVIHQEHSHVYRVDGALGEPVDVGERALSIKVMQWRRHCRQAGDRRL
jgi:hypothetical protein